MSTVVGQSRMVGVWGATDGELLAAPFVANRKKRNATKHKTNAPFAITPPPNVPKRSLGRIPGHAPLAVSFHFHPPFIPRKPTPCLISRPPPPLAVATAFWSATHTSARKQASFIWGRRRLSVTSTGRRSDWQASGTGGKFKNKDAFPPKKKDPYMISLLIRGEDDQGIDLAIPFPCDLAESGVFSLQLQNLENITFCQIGTK